MKTIIKFKLYANYHGTRRTAIKLPILETMRDDSSKIRIP